MGSLSRPGYPPGMAQRFYVLTPPTGARGGWAQHVCGEIRACDWWISAEHAGLDEDSELVQQLATGTPTVVQGEVVVDHGVHGRVSVAPRDHGDLEVYVAEGTLPAWALTAGSAALVITLQGVSGAGAALLVEAYASIATSLAGGAGWVWAPSGAVWDASAGTWS